MAVDFVIDKEIEDFLPPRTAEETRKLEKQILDSQHVDDLVVATLNGDKILIDGHGRKPIAEHAGIPFKTREIPFETREQMLIWVIDNQFGRRNLTEAQKQNLRGWEFNTKKAEKGGHPKTQKKKGDTATQVAKKHGVSRSTVIRDAKFNRTIDHIRKTDPDRAKRILAGEEKIGRKDSLEADKNLCKRCKRVGPVRGCADCADLKNKAVLKKKAGSESYSFKGFYHDYGALLRQIDILGISYKCKESDEAKALRTQLKTFKSDFRAWYEKVSGQKPPAE